MSVSGPDGTIAAFRDIPVKRQHPRAHQQFQPDPARAIRPERAGVEKEGWEVAYDGMEVSP